MTKRNETGNSDRESGGGASALSLMTTYILLLDGTHTILLICCSRELLLRNLVQPRGLTQGSVGVTERSGLQCPGVYQWDRGALL